MCTSFVSQRGCQPSAPSCRRSCGDTPGHKSIMGKRKCGTGLATAPSLATFWTKQLAHWIQSSPQCGEEEENKHEGIVILGTPLGHKDFVRAQQHIVDEHNVLLERIPSIPDVQSAWALLLHCANARANCVLRVIRPDLAISHKLMTPGCAGACAPF